MGVHTETTERVEGLLRAWNARDLDRFVACLAEDVHWHDLGMLHPPAVGRAEVRRFGELVLRAFPDFTFELRAPVCVAADGGSCCVPWTITATSSGSYDPPGLAPTGRRLRFDGMDYVTFQGGLVARIETRFDPADVVEQLMGVRIRPAAGSFAEWCFVRAQRVMAAWLRGHPPAVGARAP